MFQKTKPSLYLITFLTLIFFIFRFPSAQNAQNEISNEPVQNNVTNCESQDETFEWNRDSIIKIIEINKSCVKDATQNNPLNFRKLGKLNRILGNPDEAVLYFNQGLDIAKTTRNNAEVSKFYGELSSIFLENGSMQKAESSLENALKFAKSSEDKSALAFANLCYGDFFYTKKDRLKATEAYQSAIEISRSSEYFEIEANANLGLGYHLLNQYDFENAIRPLNESLESFQKASNQRGIVFSYKALGTYHNLNQDKQKALEYYQKAEQLFPEKVDYIEKASLLNSIGSIYENYGDWKLSKIYREKALNIFKQNNHLFGQLTTLSSLGAVNRLDGKTNEAITNLNDARQIADEVEDKFYQAVVLEELGIIYYESGSNELALQHFNTALDYFLSEKINSEIALIYQKIGKIYETEKKPDLARSYYSKSLEFARKVKNRFLEADLLLCLARIELLKNQSEKALELVKHSINLTENLTGNVYNSKLQQSYLSNSFERYEFYIHTLMKLYDDSNEEDFSINALQASEKSRARSLLENLSLSEANITKDADPETVKREQEIRVLLNTKADKLTDLLSQNAEKEETDKISGEINELENELENIKAALKQNSPIYSAIQNPAPFDVGEFQAKILDENSLLLEFSFGKEASYLWVIDKNSVDSFVLPPREQIETHIEKLRQLLASREMKDGETLEDFQRRISDAESVFKIEAMELSRKLFGQVADKFANKRLIIVPDGKLHYFPVSALPLPDSASDEPILMTNETVYAPSAQTLLLLEKSRAQTAETAKDLLIFSDPIFTTDDARFSAENKPSDKVIAETTLKESFRFVESLDSLPRLTASKNESDSIINIIGASNSDIFSGFNANREQLLNVKAGDYKILHFATHGITNEKRPELSGIVLSRFDDRGQQRDEFFRIQDIYGLNLNADLVVLSACETGLGKEVKGEGLMSLNNAFLQTGAKSVMASLWKVEDTATLELMKNFYGAIADEKLTPPQALRRAQIKLRENRQYRSPFYWAAFTVQGDFRNVPTITKKFNHSLYLLGLIPFMLIGIYFLRRKLIRRNS